MCPENFYGRTQTLLKKKIVKFFTSKCIVEKYVRELNIYFIIRNNLICGLYCMSPGKIIMNFMLSRKGELVACLSGKFTPYSLKRDNS